MYRESKTGLWCRENTLDEYVIKEQSSYKEFFALMEGKRVADIGANIGAFAYNALKAGANEVVCFEPDPDNVKMFRKQNLNAKLISRAVADKTGTREFYVNTGKNKGLHSLQPYRGRDVIKVRTVSFQEVLERYKPQLVKIDIEGGEYGLNLNLPEYVEAICIEIHLTAKGHRSLGKALTKRLAEDFPYVLHEAHITDKNWTTLFIGKRKENING